MSSTSSSSQSKCLNKREVLNRVKEILEKFRQSDLIDGEGFKNLAKKSSERITPPAYVTEVERVVLEQLIIYLTECGVEESLIAPIHERLAEVNKSLEKTSGEEEVATAAAKAGEEANGGAKENHNQNNNNNNQNSKEVQSKSGVRAGATGGLSFTALKERMSRKREGLQRAQVEAPMNINTNTNKNIPTTTNTNTAVSSLAPTSTADGEEPPPTRRHKIEAPVPLLIPPPSHEEVDLYADLGGGGGGSSVW